MMKKLDRAAVVLTKLIEIAHWIGAVSCVVGLVLLFTMGERALVPGTTEINEEIVIYSFAIMVTDGAGKVNMGALRALLVVGMVNMGLMAMVFRNVHLILKRSENDTPFQPDNIRMVREIGIFLIAVPVAGLVMSVVVRLLLGVDAVESSVNLSTAVVGLVVLCLGRVFAKGMELENETEGLL